MSDDLLAQIDRTLAQANARGVLQPIRTESTQLNERGFDFTVRWVSSLARKDTERVNAAVRRDPDFNPFLPPEHELTVGPIGEAHLGVLNKFPVIARHLLVVTRHFEAQTAPLTVADFAALWSVMQELGGLGFYNGGTEAGASQRHKHLQWVPGPAAGQDPDVFSPRSGAPGYLSENPALPWQHRYAQLPETIDGAILRDAFSSACEALGIRPAAGGMPPYNLLLTRRWLLVVPRSREHYAGISVNALGFAGSLFVRHAEQIEEVRQLGPLRLLTAVAYPR